MANQPLEMFGVALCGCDEEDREREVIDGIVFDANCHGVIGLETDPTPNEADLRGPARDEWKHEAAEWKRLK